LTLNSPIGFCGKYYNSTVPVSETVVLGSTVVPVTLTVTGPDDSPITYTGDTLSPSKQVTIAGVALKVGKSTIKARVTEPSGNYRELPVGCTVEVGDNPPPTVTWKTPLATSVLTAPGNTSTGAIVDGDTSEGATGWQGTLKACTDLSADAAATTTVTFSANGNAIGSPVSLAYDAVETKYCATLENASVPEGAAVALKATTSEGASGSGSATITIPVDVTIPSQPTVLAATVKNRRESSFNFNWKAPADGTKAAAGYVVKISEAAITSENFDAAETLPYSNTPSAAGSDDGVVVSGRTIERNYYFAVRAVDSVGNKGPIALLTTPTKASFLVQKVVPPTSGLKEQFGWVVDGGSDLNGDGYSDLIVGTLNANSVYVYLGTANGIALSVGGVAQVPSLTFTGTSLFGQATGGIGDFNKDGVDDLAVGDPGDGNGTVHVFYGSKSWSTEASRSIDVSAADLTISADNSGTGDTNYTNAKAGRSIARLGDVNNDGADDFAFGVPNYNNGSFQGQVVVVFGKSGGYTSKTMTLPAAFGSGALHIDGDAAVSQGNFGNALIGIGQFYGTGTRNTLVVAAPYAGYVEGVPPADDTFTGELYAFDFNGVASDTSSIALSARSHYYPGIVTNVDGLGSSGMELLGNWGPGNQPVLGVNLPYYDAIGGRVQCFSGSTVNGPFASYNWLKSTLDNNAPPRLGRLVIGGAIRGLGTSVSYVGNSASDVIVATRANGDPRLFIVDGTKLSLSSTNGTEINMNTLADVVLKVPAVLPAEGEQVFVDFANYNNPLKDLDNDSYADFAFGDIDYADGSTKDGVVWVYR
jgi:hypothetical protein